jgi:hypothetical protein
VRGRGTPSRGQGAAGASTGDEGIPAPLHTHTVSCPPLSHRDRVHSQAVPDPVQEEGRAMDPNVLRRSPLHLSEVGAHRTLSWHPQFNAHVRRPSIPSGTQSWLGIDYKKRLVDLRNLCSENPYKFIKFEGVEERFWSQFQNDFYESILYKASKATKNGPLFQHKYVVLKSLQEFNHPEVTALIHKL